MELVNRHEALSRIAALARADEGALIVTGEPGRGKTQLLHAARDASPIRVELVRVPPGESSFPLAGFSAVFDAIRGEHSTNFTRKFELRSDEPNGLFAAAHDLLDLVHGLQLPPTMILIDSVDRMDLVSQSLIGTIAAHLPGTGLRIVATASTIEQGSPLADVPEVELSPVTVDELIETFTHHPDADDSTLRILAGYAGGNPAVFAEQCRLLPPDQLAGSAWLTLPPPVTPMLERVTGWPGQVRDRATRHVLETVSLAPLCHASALADFLGESADLVEDLIDANVLQRRGAHVSFVDHRLRSHVYWSQRARTRRERHAELTGLVAVHDERLACWHYSFSVLDEDTVGAMLSAAIWLVALHRIPEAVEFVERALQHANQVERHAELLVTLCGQLLGSGSVSLAARYSERTRAPATEPRRVMELAALNLAAQLFDRQVMKEEEAKTLVALHADENLDRASDLLTLTALNRAERWEVEEARHLMEPTRAHAAHVSPETRDKVAAMTEILDALEGTPVPSPDGDSLLVDELDPMPPEVLLMRGRALTLRERYADARGMLTLVLNHPTSQRRIWSDFATYASIGNEIAAGEFRLARDAITSWGTGSPWINRRTAAQASVRAWSHYSVGELVEARQFVDMTLDLAANEASQSARARAYALAGAVDLLEGDPERALTNLRHASAMSRRFRNPALLRHWADYTEACVLTGRLQEAGAAVAALQRRLTIHQSRWGELALARCRALVAPGPESLALFATATDMFGRGELPYESGRTRAAFADRQDSLGGHGDGHLHRVDAVTAFEAAGADAWAARTRSPTADVHAPARDTNSLLARLTPDEREVAQCVLRGMKTREIAETLYISVRTVELRLTRTYRKLHVSSRAELVALLHGDRPAPDQ